MKIFPITPGMVYLVVQDAAKRCGMTIRPHDLRRSYSRLSRDGGAPLEQIQVTLGHASINTTMRYIGSNLSTKPGEAMQGLYQILHKGITHGKRRRLEQHQRIQTRRNGVHWYVTGTTGGACCSCGDPATGQKKKSHAENTPFGVRA